jgi:uncharacterized hydrophobic protein (TIGR00271 family)
MLHVRVVSPSHESNRLIDALEGEPGVINVVLLPAAARRPPGDVVHFDVSTAVANRVFQQVRALGLARYGTVTVDTIEAAITDPADGARAGGQGRGFEPVWEMVEAAIRAGAAYPPSFFLLLVLAGLIAAVGILTNSQILIVGAMVVGPEYSAIMGAALGLTQRDWGAVGRALVVLFVGFTAAIVVTLGFSVIMRNSTAVPKAFQLGIRPVSNLINAPNAFSVIVAVLAGIVGVVSMTEARANALIGVFISVTTIPAAADVAVSLAFESWSEAKGSAVQLLLNVVLLIVVGAATLSLQRWFWRTRRRALGARPAK